MPFFSTPLAKLTESDLREIVSDELQESEMLELKREVPRDRTLVRQLCALGNTLGGRMVIGIRQRKGGIADSLDGVTEDPALPTRVAVLLFDRISPPLSVRVSPPIQVSTTGQVAYVIEVDSSPLAPHFIKGRAGCYVRVADSSHVFRTKQAEPQELEWLFSRRARSVGLRENLEETFRRRWLSFAEWSGHEELDHGIWLTGFISPKFPTATRSSLAALKSEAPGIVRTCPLTLMFGAEEVHYQDGAVLVARRRAQPRTIIEFGEHGHVGFALAPELLRTDAHAAARLDVPVNAPWVEAWWLFAGLRMMLELAGAFCKWTEYEGPLHVVATIHNPQQELILGMNSMNQCFLKSRTPFDRKSGNLFQVETGQFVQGSESVARKMFSRLMFGMGWAASDAEHEKRVLDILESAVVERLKR